MTIRYDRSANYYLVMLLDHRTANSSSIFTVIHDRFASFISCVAGPSICSRYMLASVAWNESFVTMYFSLSREIADGNISRNRNMHRTCYTYMPTGRENHEMVRCIALQKCQRVPFNAFSLITRLISREQRTAIKTPESRKGYRRPRISKSSALRRFMYVFKKRDLSSVKYAKTSAEWKEKRPRSWLSISSDQLQAILWYCLHETMRIMMLIDRINSRWHDRWGKAVDKLAQNWYGA
jgi:hypothetical protein